MERGGRAGFGWDLRVGRLGGSDAQWLRTGGWTTEDGGFAWFMLDLFWIPMGMCVNEE
jgi:hypothetical protein